MVRVIVLSVAAFVLAAQEENPKKIPKENPYKSERDVARGKQLFLGHCAPCHGPAGDGGRGANLARPKLPRAPDDAALFQVIKEGLPATEMPGAWEMIDREIWQVAAFVRTLGRAAVENVPGNRARGEELFRTKGNCRQCHTVNGQGGLMGPDLTEIGARRSSAYLRTALLEPEASVPEGFLLLTLKTRKSEAIRGIRLNESTYSIQILDLSGKPHSFWKEELSEIRKEPGKSPMPSYKNTFSEPELTDLIAYLVSLRGGL